MNLVLNSLKSLWVKAASISRVGAKNLKQKPICKGLFNAKALQSKVQDVVLGQKSQGHTVHITGHFNVTVSLKQVADARSVFLKGATFVSITESGKLP
jgi:hypothetical protein